MVSLECAALCAACGREKASRSKSGALAKLPPEIQLNSISRPRRNTRSKKITIFCPDRAIQCQRYRCNRPVVFVTPYHALSCTGFKVCIEGVVYDFNPVAHTR